MSNPFEYLRKRRLTEEAQLRKEREARELAINQRKKEELQRREYLESLSKQNSEMVIRVLQDLKEVLYPNSELEGWSIGHRESGYDSGTDTHWEGWNGLVSIRLVLEGKNAFLECRTKLFQSNDGSRIKKCLLQERDLIATLQKLHEEHVKRR
jgi:hypothetical protein